MVTSDADNQKLKMKKQFLVLATTVVSLVIISCSKEKTEMESSTLNPGEQTASSNAPAERLVVDPLLVNLEGRFEFNSNLKDLSKKLGDGVPTRRGVSYGFDRKGNFKAALYLDSTYSVKLNDVPQQTKTSLSVWVKPVHLQNGFGGIVTHQTMGPKVDQSVARLSCAVATDISTPGEYIDIFYPGWHHVVITYDGSNVRAYINNVLKATLPHSASISPSLIDYVVGWSYIWDCNWKGYVDDLRFYSRTLSASDVQKLYNL